MTISCMQRRGTATHVLYTTHASLAHFATLHAARAPNYQSLDLEGPRRWQTKHAEELKNMLPLRRLKGLGLHRNDSKFTELSTDDITQLVKEVRQGRGQTG